MKYKSFLWPGMIYLNKKNSFLLKANIHRPLNHCWRKNWRQLERVDLADNDYRVTVSNSLSPVLWGWESKQLPTVGALGQPVHTAACPLPGAPGCLLHIHCCLLMPRCGCATTDEPWKYEPSTTDLNHSVTSVSSSCPTSPQYYSCQSLWSLPID